MTQRLHCLYRISDNSYVKPRLANATKKDCLLNFLEHFSNTGYAPEENPVGVTVFVDKVVPETKVWLEDMQAIQGLPLVFIDGGSSAQSFKHIVDHAIGLPSDDYVYLIEDDYLHLDHSCINLMDALQRSHYVSLYDHVDKYIPASKGGNPYIDDDGGEVTKVLLGKDRHWKLTNSTTCTFACQVKTLQEDYEIWKKWSFHTKDQTHPHDFQCFLELRETGRSLITPIPTLATHCDVDWLAPLVDWTQV